MNEIVNKLAIVEKQMALEKGRFLLFALFLREDAPDVWDVVVAAPWVSDNKADSLKYISDKIRAALTPGELLKISRIVLIEKDSPALPALPKATNIEHGRVEIRDSNFFGLQIKHAYLITSSRNGAATSGMRREA